MSVQSVRYLAGSDVYMQPHGLVHAYRYIYLHPDRKFFIVYA